MKVTYNPGVLLVCIVAGTAIYYISHSSVPVASVISMIIIVVISYLIGNMSPSLKNVEDNMMDSPCVFIHTEPYHNTYSVTLLNTTNDTLYGYITLPKTIYTNNEPITYNIYGKLLPQYSRILYTGQISELSSSNTRHKHGTYVPTFDQNARINVSIVKGNI